MARREAAMTAEFVVRDAFSGNQLSPPCPSQVLDLSPRGCCLALGQLDCGGFHLHRCLQAPQDYILELRLTGDNGRVRQIPAEVRWLNREMNQQSLPFRAGLYFPGRDKPTLALRRRILGG